MALPVQETLNLHLPEAFTPTARSLRPGDVLEGHSGRAFPRPLLVHGTETCGDDIRVIYSEKVGNTEHFATLILPANADVDLMPPF
jgi:hypothetical protein